MIKEIQLKNFRSIEKSKILFDTPLKVLIGENGTGKTNVLLALQFISECLRSSPLRAIQNAGGLDQVFRIKEKRTTECSFSVLLKLPNRSNTHRIDTLFHRHPKYRDRYETADNFVRYEFSLRYLASEQQLQVSREVLTYGDDPSCEDVIFDRDKKSLSTEKFEIRQLDFSDYDVDRLFIHNVAFGRVLQKKRSELTEEQEYAEFEINLVNDTLVELANIVGYNFSPHVLRKTSDILDPEEMGYNGQNFPSLVYHLMGSTARKREIVRRHRGRYSMRPRSYKRILNDIEEAYQEILPFLKEISTEEGIDSTTINLQFKESHLKKKKYGVAHLSDGTLKFLALSFVTCMSNYSFLFFEEIENFLNPRAISYLFDQIRDYSKEFNVQFLLTTHSETVLNFCEPEEVLISKRKDSGSTTYIKPKNLKTLNKELDAGGFGLGTYWSSGGIQVD